MEIVYAEIITVILGLAAAFLGVKYRQWVGKARLFVTVLNSIVAAAEDERISDEELKQIIKQAKQLVDREENEGD